MEKAQSELIQQLYDNGCITEEEVEILQIPQSYTVVTNIKNWLKSLDENINYTEPQ